MFLDILPHFVSVDSQFWSTCLSLSPCAWLSHSSVPPGLAVLSFSHKYAFSLVSQIILVGLLWFECAMPLRGSCVCPRGLQMVVLLERWEFAGGVNGQGMPWGLIVLLTGLHLLPVCSVMWPGVLMLLQLCLLHQDRLFLFHSSPIWFTC